jgi:hypothetical protein
VLSVRRENRLHGEESTSDDDDDDDDFGMWNNVKEALCDEF